MIMKTDKMFRLKPNYEPNLYNVLTQNDMPPTLYSLMNSMVNYKALEKTKISDLPSKARETIFDFEYPIGAEYKKNFEEMFLSHFMFRRIGFETFTAFQINLKVKLNEIMPRYSKMLEGSSLLDFDGDVETHERVENSSNENKNNSTIGTVTDNRYSDTPENQLTDVQNGTYLTDYTYTQGNTTNNTLGSNTYNTKEDIVIKKKDSIDEYEKFLKITNDIYSMIFKDCDILFYQVI